MPQRGLDDTVAYRNYTTRFYRDSRGNAVQIYLDMTSGRVVHVWADDADESLAFTARTPDGRPAQAVWDAPDARVTEAGRFRQLEYDLTFESPVVDIGLILLGSMRVERDFCYWRRQFEPFTKQPTLNLEETDKLFSTLASLTPPEQRNHLAVLNCRSITEARSRLLPSDRLRREGGGLTYSVTQATLDGKNHLTLALSVRAGEATMIRSDEKLTIRSNHAGKIRLSVRIGTDSPPLTPLTREQIFNSGFLQYLDSLRTTGLRYLWLDREVRGIELLTYREKMMAGLPNFATYFGRDMMMSAMMLESIWRPQMLEHVVGSVLRKVSPAGEVSHEEALGGQAIRENAAEYATLVETYHSKTPGDPAAPDLLRRARAILADLQRVRENYRMVDSRYQFPVVAARYLESTSITPEEKRSFLDGPAAPGSTVTRLHALLRNLVLVSRLAAPFVPTAAAGHGRADSLVSFPRQDDTTWISSSWRDSRAGYARGRFAMDVNVVWVPEALRSVGIISRVLVDLGYGLRDLSQTAPELAGSELEEYLTYPDSLHKAIAAWDGARQLFCVNYSGEEVRAKIHDRLQWLPPEERDYWHNVIGSSGGLYPPVSFLALSLDGRGNPIPVMHSDLATLLYSEDLDSASLHTAVGFLEGLMRPYPVGLFVDSLGVLVANDTYAPRPVWEAFRADKYHSPYVVWGREVNLLQLGLVKQLLARTQAASQPGHEAATDDIRAMRVQLGRIRAAVEASGLKHEELWSYGIHNGRLQPERYGTSCDVQLWNLTDLAVQWMLSKVGQ